VGYWGIAFAYFGLKWLTASASVDLPRLDQVHIDLPVSRALRGVDPQVPIVKVRTMDQIITDSIASRKFQTALARSFAFCALFLAGLGIFSVASYSVSQRRHELAIRMALGATSSNIRRLIIRDGMKPIILGMLFGIAAAFIVGKAVNSLFWEWALVIR